MQKESRLLWYPQKPRMKCTPKEIKTSPGKVTKQGGKRS